MECVHFFKNLKKILKLCDLDEDLINEYDDENLFEESIVKFLRNSLGSTYFSDMEKKNIFGKIYFESPEKLCFTPGEKMQLLLLYRNCVKNKAANGKNEIPFKKKENR